MTDTLRLVERLREMDAQAARQSKGKFKPGESLYAAAADEIERLRVMAYQPVSRHVEGCDCGQCVPF